MTSDPDSQPYAEPVAASDSNRPLEAYEEMTCEVCGDPIEKGTEYIPAAYGPVHAEPCSHQGKVS